MPADAPPPLDTPSLIHMLKQQLGVDFVILAGYLKVIFAISQCTACCWQTLSFVISQQCRQSQVAVL